MKVDHATETAEIINSAHDARREALLVDRRRQIELSQKFLKTSRALWEGERRCREKAGVPVAAATVRALFKGARSRAKNSCKSFTLDASKIEAVIAAGRCEATGIPFDLSGKPHGMRSNPYAPSLDRIDCAEGYTQRNTRVVIASFNVMRNDFPDEVLETVFKAWLAKRCLNIPEEETTP